MSADLAKIAAGGLVGDRDDLELLADTIFGEARGGSFDGRVAVAWVVLNRVLWVRAWCGRRQARGQALKVHPLFGDGSIGGACTAANGGVHQFSCWNESDPNRLAIARARVSDPVFVECLGIAGLVAAAAGGRGGVPREFRDPTFGSKHYITRRLWQTRPPSWCAGRMPVVDLGDHVFFNDIP